MNAPLRPGSEDLLRHFELPSGRTYLDSASYGLPPKATIDALRFALEQWQTGGADALMDWDPAGEECRALMAELLAVEAEHLTLLPAVSAGVAVLAASLQPDDEILVADDEFNSLLLPFVVAHQHRGCSVRRVPYAALADEVTDATTVVATSYVRSNGGAVQDLDVLSDAARAHGAMLAVDATQAVGILPLEIARRGIDIAYVAAYKHLLCPRGVAFMWVAPEHQTRLAPYAASWRSTSPLYASYYGGHLDDLAPGAARFDLSLAWHSWVGARESLRFLLGVREEDRQSWCVGLASDLAIALGLEPTGSSVLGIPVEGDAAAVRELFASAGVVASMRLGQVRVSFHIYNEPADVETVVSLLRGRVRKAVRK